MVCAACSRATTANKTTALPSRLADSVGRASPPPRQPQSPGVIRPLCSGIAAPDASSPLKRILWQLSTFRCTQGSPSRPGRERAPQNLALPDLCRPHAGLLQHVHTARSSVCRLAGSHSPESASDQSRALFRSSATNLKETQGNSVLWEAVVKLNEALIAF